MTKLWQVVLLYQCSPTEHFGNKVDLICGLKGFLSVYFASFKSIMQFYAHFNRADVHIRASTFGLSFGYLSSKRVDSFSQQLYSIDLWMTRFLKVSPGADAISLSCHIYNKFCRFLFLVRSFQTHV